MQERILKAKHWQLFLLMFGVPIVLQTVLVVGIFTHVFNETDPDTASMLNIIRVVPFLVILYIAVYFGWLWAVGYRLQDLLPENLKLPLNWFRVTLIFPVIYFSVFLILINNILNHDDVGSAVLNQSSTSYILIFILPFHFFAMFCMIYNLYFVAKTIKTVEMQQKTTFSDFIGEFVLIWIFVLGVWVLQPKINVWAEKLFGKE